VVAQVWTLPGAHAPWPVQVDQVDQTPLLQVREWVPQLPQASTASPVQLCPVQEFHLQELLQVCLPFVPHAWLSFGLHSPWFMQADQADQTPLLQVRVCEPQLPQLCEVTPVQVCPVQFPHTQVLLQV
jgi:hypothetical protein